MKLKIMEYNVMNGFCNEKIPYELQKERLTDAAKIIKKENPDILVLCEAYFWPFAKEDSLKNIGKTFEKLYDSYAPQPENTFRWAPIILSKFPIKSYDSSLGKYFLNFLRSKIKVGKNLITLDVFHPHPSTTEKQKSDFLKEVTKNINGKHIIAGDFNSLSSEDNYDRKKLIKGYTNFMGYEGKEKVNDMLKTMLVAEILSKSFIDTYKIKNNNFDFTIPTDLLSKNKDSAVRVDYIFSKSFKILDSKIIKSKLTEKASDHYPIVAELELK